MNYHVLTLFPDMIRDCMNYSITGKAMEKGLLSLNCVNIRDYTRNKHQKVDDYIYGGGAGLLMQAEPVYLAYRALVSQMGITLPDTDGTKEEVYEAFAKKKKPRVVMMTPVGKLFTQKMAEDFSKEEDLIFLCGHYEGIDERVLEMIVTDPVCIGDYVLTGGELASMVVMDAVSRLVPGVLHNEESAQTESFSEDLLEFPQYSRPEVFMGEAVPPVLLSGHHANVEQWRREESLKRTKKYRPDLLEKASLTRKDELFLAQVEKNSPL
ncbi:MAG: tRNA (guanosine(37)-N1)-methyltransferase TrmD [Lachnospiraceae bacterium]|nr:tRNA (guanosine(37)-N1)-methyltransferase TrmD [Lachnospiraceae bacterium]